MPVTRSPSRPPSGSPAYSPTDLPAYRGGSSFSPLDLSPLAWARCPDAPDSVSCAITLTGDIAAVFGGQPLDISGQMVSKTVPAAPANSYIAGGASTISGWSGWRAVGYQASDFTTAGNSEHTLVVINSTNTTYVGLLYSEAVASWAVLVNGGSVGAFAGASEDKVAIRVDGASGDVEVRVNGVTKTKADIAPLDGLFSGSAVLPAVVLGSLASPTLTAGDTYAAQIFTAAADLADVGFPAGTLDWCGNAIEVVDGLYQDSAGTTPVTGAGQDVGLRLDYSQGLVLGPELVTTGVFSVTADGTNKVAVSIPVSAQPSAVGYWIRFRIDTNTLSGGGGVRIGGFSSSDVFVPALSVASSVGVHNIFGVSKSSGARTEVNLWITSAFTSGQLIGEVESIRAIAGNHFTQATATARPTYEISPARLEYDVDDALSCTLPAISGGQIVIISPAGTWIDSFDFAGGTFTVGPNTYTGGPAGLMSLLGNAEIEIIILPTPMTAAEQTKMLAYAETIGGSGVIIT